jgi:tungstate transport system substrate-binding protein
MEGKALRMLAAALALLIVGTFSVSAADTSGGERLKLATTTSLYDTKLLDLIQTRFQDKYGVPLDIVSGGTGIAIQYGERGDVDVMIIHDKARELKFVKDGHGLQRRCIAFNYFYVVGPADDPAGIKGLNASSAFKTIMEKGLSDPGKIKFISRGDNSGTHSKEQQLWKKAGYNYTDVNTSGQWYVEAGQGMGATLMMANEKQAYTLTDMSTFMAYRGNLTLIPLIEGGSELLNVYVAIAINPVKHPGVNCTLANRFIDYLVSEEGQKLIGDFGRDKYGQSLFYPAAGNCTLIGCSSGECAVPTNATCTTA